MGLWLTPGGVIPWGTLAANLIGGYLIGICLAVFQAMPQLDLVWRLLLVTGFLTIQFQSTPIITDGRCNSFHTDAFKRIGFNPRPSSLTGDAMASPGCRNTLGDSPLLSSS